MEKSRNTRKTVATRGGTKKSKQGAEERIDKHCSYGRDEKEMYRLKKPNDYFMF